MKLQIGMQVTSISGRIRGKIIRIDPSSVFNIWIDDLPFPMSDAELKPVILHLKSTERKWQEHKASFIKSGRLPNLALSGSELTGEQLEVISEFIGGFDANIPYGDAYLEAQWNIIRRYGAIEYRRQSYKKWLEKNAYYKALIELDKQEFAEQ